MSKSTISHNSITLKQLEKEMAILRKKIFIYETFQAEKEIKEGKVEGPYKNGKEVIADIKS